MDAVDPTKTARHNESNHASFTHEALSKPFAAGAFRWVAKGKYTEGSRRGEACVCRWFKTNSDLEDSFFATDLEASQKAVDLITKWNTQRLIDRMVKVNLPEIWTFTSRSGEWAGRQVLQEPFIEHYQKFNSNSGWADDSLPWPRVMQALSHFTYHISNGQYLLCDLQGGIYRDGVILTDPVVLSNTRQYGPTDLGPEGMSTFFAHHECNEFCAAQWKQPKNAHAYYRKTPGTTMEHHVSTVHSRQPLTRRRY